jgi:hypothetical protein
MLMVTVIDTFTKDYSKDVKSNFQWDFDKVGNKIQNFGDTIKGNIDAYDKYVEDNLGISKNVSNVLRAGAVVKGVCNLWYGRSISSFCNSIYGWWCS